MKSFEISYMVRYSTTQIVEARNEKEAREKFRKERPSAQILYVNEYAEGDYSDN